MPVKARLTLRSRSVTIQDMIETFSFFIGLGFSFLVYFLSIRPRQDSGWKKAGYFFFTLIGITGTLFLSGVLIAHFLRKLGISR
jgi:hypothetical protein